jgi:ABC-type uncharacterized transport system ATPase subunit
MESVSKTGKVFKGKLAALMIKVGVAKPLKEELTARQVADQIALVTDLEILSEFENDTRQVVKNAYKKKLKELN